MQQSSEMAKYSFVINKDLSHSQIHSVEVFVAGVNAHLTTRQENERLKGINARIDSYDVVDSNNEHLDKMVKQYSTMLDLSLPMHGTVEGRKLFLEGDLKFKDSLGKVRRLRINQKGL